MHKATKNCKLTLDVWLFRPGPQLQSDCGILLDASGTKAS